MKTDRLIGILSILMQRSITAGELAEKFEVSRRTILRDIDDISMAGIPIVSAKGKGGGYSVMEGFCLDRTLLSREDMGALLTGLMGLDSISGSPRYRQLMDKLSADSGGEGRSVQLNPDSCFIIDLSCWDKSAVSGKIEVIREAAKKGEMISFRYFAPSGESMRRIEPYRLIFQWRSWYVWGYCTDREDFRIFRLSRISGLANTGERFKAREVPVYSCGSCFCTNDIAAKVRFDGSVKWRVIDEVGLERMHMNSDGSCTAECTWSDRESFLSFILSFGDRAEIISPACLRRELADMAARIAGIYS